MDFETAMRRADALAQAVLGTTSPNPAVGAVALDINGDVVGEGVTAPPGGPHAEVRALEAAAGRTDTLVVTLEPCNHTGRTGPCSEAVIAAGVRRVVIACAEPTANAAGGVAALRAAGIEVVTGCIEPEIARGALEGWLHVQRTGLPFVTWKYAATLDGRSAAADGTSKWITGEEARADVHRLRAASDAVVVGVGTVVADDPELTVRPDPGHQPLRVVVDPSGRAPTGARVFGPGAETWHATGTRDLHELLKELADRRVVNVLLEGGPTLAGAFLEAGLVDRVIGYVAPALLGDGPAALGSAGVGTISDAVRLQLVEVARLGDDVRLTLRRT